MNISTVQVIIDNLGPPGIGETLLKFKILVILV